MATVRISDRLYGDIVENTKRLFTKRKKQAKQDYNRNWGKRIHKELFPNELISKLNTLGNNWFKHTEKLTLHGFYNTPDETIQRTYGIEISFEIPKTKVPENWDSDMESYGWKGSMDSYSGISLTLDTKNPKWESILDEYKIFRQKIYDINQEEDKNVSTVKTVLDNFTTLAPCIRAMPKLYDLIPEHTRERHDEVTEKRVRVKPEDLDIDTSGLDVAMVKNKITQGGE